MHSLISIDMLIITLFHMVKNSKNLYIFQFQNSHVLKSRSDIPYVYLSFCQILSISLHRFKRYCQMISVLSITLRYRLRFSLPPLMFLHAHAYMLKISH